MTARDIPRGCLDREYAMLRAELHDLKACQIRLLTLGVTASGAIIGLGTGMDSTGILAQVHLLWLVFLSPLLLLLPFWRLFFDKAMTVSRIIGYQRVLERLMLNPDETLIKFPGWENALDLFRDQKRTAFAGGGAQKEGQERGWRRALQVLKATPYKYWVINYSLFAILSVVCLGCACGFSRAGPGAALLAVAACFLVLTAVQTGRILLLLTDGLHSYQRNYSLWEETLGLESDEVQR